GASLTWKAVRGTKVVWTTVVVLTVTQTAITYLPPLQAVFATESIPLLDGALIVGVGVALFALLETEKQVRLAIQRARAPAYAGT
ncbi:MAG TPA: cation transporting ATPase C-terminal domain-containing protein, partial [Phenylobacterium sp.]|nr:cation transporting ATPase C-terminal domain-containing protein [Phenylobacterium sp.]